MNSSAIFRLRLFGSPTLERGDGSAVTGRAAQRHRLALLALLAQAPAQRLSRDKIIAYLWPETESDRGRNLLSVSTYVLRAAVGEGAVVSEGEDLRLNSGTIRTDVEEFEAALQRNDYEHAVALYPAPFLDGFFLSRAAEFEQWVTRERQRLADAYGKSLEALAETAEAAHDFERALQWWKARASHDPYDSRVALRLMQALDASGNRAGALHYAIVHQRLLQQEFGVDAAPEIRAFAGRMRLAPEAKPAWAFRREPAPERKAGLSTDSEKPKDGTPESLPPASGRSKAAKRQWSAAAALLAATVLIATVWTVWPRGAHPARSIVVLPFTNIGPAESSDYFTDGLTDEIITTLSAVPALRVISRTSAMHYKTSGKSVSQIADELNVANVLQGSVRRSEGSVEISAWLVKADTDRQIWAKNYYNRIRDTLNVQYQISRDVAQALEVELGDRARALMARQEAPDPEAYELYRRGRFLWTTRTKQGHEQAIEYYHKAIQRDSGYAAPYAGLADAYLTGYQLGWSQTAEPEVYSRIKWAAERALALDDQLAGAHASLAIVLWWQRNWPGAERELRRAIELNPGDANARCWYSILLSGLGRTDEALRESRRAYELDPFAIIISITSAWQCYVVRDYDCAIKQFQRTLEINPSWTPAHAGLAMSYVRKGMREESMRAIKRAVELSPKSGFARADLAYAYASFGEPNLAREALMQSKRLGADAFPVALVHVALGEADSAFVWLEKSSWVWPHRALRLDPALDPIRSDPRFARLSARIDREMGLQ